MIFPKVKIKLRNNINRLHINNDPMNAVIDILTDKYFNYEKHYDMIKEKYPNILVFLYYDDNDLIKLFGEKEYKRILYSLGEGFDLSFIATDKFLETFILLANKLETKLSKREMVIEVSKFAPTALCNVNKLISPTSHILRIKNFYDKYGPLSTINYISKIYGIPLNIAKAVFNHMSKM